MARKLKDLPKSLSSFKELRDKATTYIDLIESKGTSLDKVNEELVNFYIRKLNELFGMAKSSKINDLSPEDEIKLKTILAFDDKEIVALRAMLKKVTNPPLQMEKAPVKKDTVQLNPEVELYKQMNERMLNRISDLEQRLVAAAQNQPPAQHFQLPPVYQQPIVETKVVQSAEVETVKAVKQSSVPADPKRIARPKNYKPPTVADMQARAFADAARIQQRTEASGIRISGQSPVDKIDVKIT